MTHCPQKVRLIGLLLLLCCFCPYFSDAQDDPAKWTLTRDLIVRPDGSPASEEAGFLLSELAASGKEGEPVTQSELVSLLDNPEGQLVYYDRVIRYATPESDSLTKAEHENYARIFMREKYQVAGVQFIKTHQRYLEGARSRFGVLPQDIVAILTWESGLGIFTGKNRVFNIMMGQILVMDRAQRYAVAEMVKAGKGNPLDDPSRRDAEARRLARRKKDATASLVTLLRMAKKMQIDPLTIKGSWGGAIGYPQFLPYNLKYAVDADGNGIDLLSWPDAIYSVANYLKERGEYGTSSAQRRKAFLRYNASQEYADGVMLLADTIWRRYQQNP
jgi:membrane-bound lytic murein transglycosylase B